MKTIIYVGLITSGLVYSTLLNAQDFKITHVELAGEKVVLYYDLLDTVQNRRYTVHVYSSKDSFLNPLEKITGDAGIEVVPGMHKKISWDVAGEYGNHFNGKVGLEIRGREYVPFVRFTGFKEQTILKRGVPFIMTWSGGTRQNVLNFELYNKKNSNVWTQPSVANTGNFEMVIPTNVKPGKEFKFKISDSKNQDEVVYTGEVVIKRKIPLVIKIAPILLVGSALYFFLPKDSGYTIPDAPCPDGTNNCNN